MKNGIIQGSVLIPLLFNVYVHELNIKLLSADADCHKVNIAVSSLTYADEIIVVASSAGALNSFLRICEKIAMDRYIENNTNKSVCQTVLPQSQDISIGVDAQLCGNFQISTPLYSRRLYQQDGP